MSTVGMLAKRSQRPVRDRFLNVARWVGVSVALMYLGYFALVAYMTNGDGVARTGTDVRWLMVGLLPAVAAVVAFGWPRLGGVLFLVVAAQHVYSAVQSYPQSQRTEYALDLGVLLSQSAMVAVPALVAGALLIAAGQRARQASTP